MGRHALAGALIGILIVAGSPAPGSTQAVAGPGPVVTGFHLTPFQVGVVMAGSGEVSPRQGRRFAVIVYTADALCGPGATVRQWTADNGTVPWPTVGTSGCIPPPPDPFPPVAALVAEASRAIPAPQVLTDPAVRGLVGLRTYFWYEGPTDVQAGADLGGYAGRAAASAVSFRWAAGDEAIGASDQPGSRDAPAVTKVFTVHGTRPLTLAVGWHGVGSVSDGASLWLVDLGTVGRASDVRLYDVPEAQALITP